VADALRASFDALVAEHEADVLAVCRSILRDDHLGADAAQETFLRLWGELERGQRPRSAGAWLQRVAVRASLDLARRRRARPDASAAGREDADTAAGGVGAAERADPASPTARAERSELRRRFERALQHLPEGQRTVFLLRHEGRIPLARVAELLGVRTTTVKTQFARACLKLQAELAPFRPTAEDPRP